jgi:polysaccharide pyruvyl transferase WcaK-like protein
MRILVDHGGYKNLGDTGMLEGGVNRLLRAAAGHQLAVREFPLPTDVWSHPNVSRVALRVAPPAARGLYLLREVAPARWHPALTRLWSAGGHALLARPFDPRAVRIDDGTPEAPTLAEWCAGYDALHVLGGGNLTDVFVEQMLARCCLIHTFAAQGKPVVLTGQQIGPFRSALSRASLARALRRARFVGLREPTDSVTFCERAGLAPGRYEVMGDDSFGVPPDAEGAEGVLRKNGLEPGRFLAVNLRLADYAFGRAQHLEKFAGLCRGLARRYGMPVVAVTIDVSELFSDLATGRRLREATGGVVQVLDEPDMTPARVKAVLGRSFAAAGVSYHFCVYTLTQGVPAVCLYDGEYYAQKARGLARFWGREGLDVALHRHEGDDLLGRVCAVIDDAAFRERLPGLAERAVARWEETFDRAVGEAVGGRAATAAP